MNDLWKRQAEDDQNEEQNWCFLTKKSKKIYELLSVLNVEGREEQFGSVNCQKTCAVHFVGLKVVPS
jgi:hypothetical protein